jgi:hypothetical protein
MQTTYGIRSDRTDPAWINVKNPQAKNLIPSEILFRFAYGGVVARELLHQLQEAGIPTLDMPASIAFPTTYILYTDRLLQH